MNRNQTADLLSAIAAFDQRTVGETDVEAWFAALGRMKFADAIAAVIEHHKTSADRIKPFHVLDIARRAANDRVERASVSREYRNHREDSRDERLAELCGGTRAALELEPGLAAASGKRASEDTRKAVMDLIRKRYQPETSQERALRLHREWQAEKGVHNFRTA